MWHFLTHLPAHFDVNEPLVFVEYNPLPALQSSYPGEVELLHVFLARLSTKPWGTLCGGRWYEPGSEWPLHELSDQVLRELEEQACSHHQAEIRVVFNQVSG